MLNFVQNVNFLASGARNLSTPVSVQNTTRLKKSQLEKKKKKSTKTVKKICYGVIEQMFVSKCGVDGTPPDVVIQGRWYAVVGADEITKLPRVAYKKNWDEDCCVSFLNQVEPVNLTMWPADPFEKSTVKGRAKYTVRKPAWKDKSFHFHPIFKHNKPKLEF